MQEIKLIQGKDREHVSKAVDLTRRMRMAILHPNVSTGSENATFSKPAQEVLLDAESLTLLTAQLVVATTASFTQQEERERLAESNVVFEKIYGSFEPLKWSPGYTEDPARAIDHFAVRYVLSPFEAVSIDFVHYSQIPLPVDQILSPQLGIVAPLSLDYHIAMTGREFTRQFVREQTFALSTAAVEPITSDVVFPRVDGKRALDQQQHIGIFVDFLATGNTVLTLHDAMEVEYWDKTIFSPLKLDRFLQEGGLIE